MSIYHFGHKRKKNLFLLQSLWLHLWSIANTTKGHITEKDQNNQNPSYPITDLDLNYYLTNIENKIKKEARPFQSKISTIPLKWALSEIHQKVRNINELRSDDKSGVKNDLWSKNKSNKYRYHHHLNRLIELARQELRLLLDKKTLDLIDSKIKEGEEKLKKLK